MNELKKKFEEMIGKVPVNEANFNHIASTGKINGSLGIDLHQALYAAYDLSTKENNKKIEALVRKYEDQLRFGDCLDDNIILTDLKTLIK